MSAKKGKPSFFVVARFVLDKRTGQETPVQAEVATGLDVQNMDTDWDVIDGPVEDRSVANSLRIAFMRDAHIR